MMGRLATRKLKVAVAVALISLITPLYLVEAVLRLFPILHHRLNYIVYEPSVFSASEWIPFRLEPGFHDVHIRRGEFSVDVRINSQGLREDREIPVPKPPKTFRILTLGDSFAFGYGVERNKLFQSRLEELLKARVPADWKVEVINAGYASGYSPDAAYVYLKREGLKLEPDLVLHVFCYSNDPGNLIENFPYSEYGKDGLPLRVQFMPMMVDPYNHQRVRRIEFKNEDAENLLHQWSGPARRTFRRALTYVALSEVTRTVRRVLQFRALEKSRGGSLEGHYMHPPEKPEALNEVYSNLDLPKGAPVDEFITGDQKRAWKIGERIFVGMKDLAAERGIPFGVILVPTGYLVDYDPKEGERSRYAKFYQLKYLDDAYRLNKPGLIFGKTFQRDGIAYLDPTLDMRKNRRTDLYFFYDAHWNETGHQVLADSVNDWLGRQGWLDKRIRAQVSGL